MAVLDQFNPPAGLTELSPADRAGWSERVRQIFRSLARTGDYPQFYDPTATDTGTDAALKTVTWPAYPATLLLDATSERGRWQRADSSRSVQDEYCEWSVQRGADGRIRRVVFTSEVPEYWEHLFAADPDRLTTLYSQMYGRDVALDELTARDGSYRRDNALNRSTEGGIAHLIQNSNNLGAAVVLAATATVLRRDAAGEPVTNQQELVRCGRLGEPNRNSDPQIAAAVNDLCAQGAQITLEDPPGLYIDGLLAAEMETPDGSDPASYWTIERGTPERALRASYEVPADAGFVVGDIEIAGRPIEYGAQLADNVQIKLTAVASAFGSHAPEREPCVG
ncbi:MAG: hypothetical protein ACRDKY_04400 [Solirubrobacteraceae bacterium]